MNPALLLVPVLLLSVACDPKASSKSDDSPGAAKSSGALAARPEPAASGDASAPTPRFGSLSECLNSCEQGDVIPTNRATCRLNCDTAYGADARGGAAAAGAGDDTLGQAASCMGRCYATTGPQDACVSGCKSVAAGAASPPAADALDRLQACVSTCPADARPTNRETCELNCAQSARVATTPPPGGASPAAR